jgi:tol-pal system protein YbgF
MRYNRLLKVIADINQRALSKMKRYFPFARFVMAAFLVAGIVTNAAGVQAQDKNIDALVSKLDRLERDIQTLNRQVYKGGTPPKSAVSAPKLVTSQPAATPASSKAYIIRLEERLSQLEGELQNTTNTIESMNHNVDQMKSRLDKLVVDIDFRLTRLEGGAVRPGAPGQVQAPLGPPTVSGVPRTAGVQQIGPTTGGPVVTSGAPSTLGKISETDLSSVQRDAKTLQQGQAPQATQAAVQPQAQPAIVKKSILPEGTPTSQYKFAFSILRKADYDNAELALREFIEKHPEDKLTPNARYWLGKTYYVRTNYRDAAEAFLRGFQQAPKGPKAPDTLLMLGVSLANLKKKSDACATFSKLGQDYPDASANIKKQLKREIGRTGCK